MSNPSRRTLITAPALLTAPALIAAAPALRSGPLTASRRAGRFELVVRPTRVFKTSDRSHEQTESWIFSLLVQTATEEKLRPGSMHIDMLRRGRVVRSVSCPTEGFLPLTFQTAARPRLPDGRAPERPFFWPWAIRLRGCEPITLGVDRLRVEVTATEEHGWRSTAALEIPIETYTQKTALIFPFRGKGIILQAGATNGGHRNRSGEFALDAMGLDEAWSVQAPGHGKKNADYPGWGRPIIAPAAGQVVRARDDRPDQPVGDASDPAFYAPEYPNGGDPGNHLVIDQGEGEFSMIAHFQGGSMLVRPGDRVSQGQALGKLGHSGDTNAPHVHYQLQAGPDWEYADALPCRFTNVSEQVLDRGTYFEAV